MIPQGAEQSGIIKVKGTKVQKALKYLLDKIISDVILKNK